LAIGVTGIVALLWPAGIVMVPPKAW